MSWQFESLKERENLEYSANYELRTLGTARGKQNLEQFLFQVLKSRTWNSLCSQNLEPGSHAGSTCAPQTQRRRRPRRVESTGHRRSTWCQWSCRQFEKSQTKHLAWKRSPFELIVFPFSSRACLQWLQLRGGFRGGFAGAPGRVGELGAETPSTWGR